MQKFKKFITSHKWEIIGTLMILHWILLAIHRISGGWAYNLLWTSHWSLLLVGIGIYRRSNLLITAAFINITIGHGLWIYDVVVLTITGNSPLNFFPFYYELTRVERLLTSHHWYLLPSTALILWKTRQVNPKAWQVSGILLAITTILAFFFAPLTENVNCVHDICGPLKVIFPFLENIEFSRVAYLFIAIAVGVVVLIAQNWAIVKLFHRYNR